MDDATDGIKIPKENILSPPRSFIIIIIIIIIKSDDDVCARAGVVIVRPASFDIQP